MPAKINFTLQLKGRAKLGLCPIDQTQASARATFTRPKHKHSKLHFHSKWEPYSLTNEGMSWIAISSTVHWKMQEITQTVQQYTNNQQLMMSTRLSYLDTYDEPNWSPQSLAVYSRTPIITWVWHRRLQSIIRPILGAYNHVDIQNIPKSITVNCEVFDNFGEGFVGCLKVDSRYCPFKMLVQSRLRLVQNASQLKATFSSRCKPNKSHLHFKMQAKSKLRSVQNTGRLWFKI